MWVVQVMRQGSQVSSIHGPFVEWAAAADLERTWNVEFAARGMVTHHAQARPVCAPDSGIRDAWWHGADGREGKATHDV